MKTMAARNRRKLWLQGTEENYGDSESTYMAETDRNNYGGKVPRKCVTFRGRGKLLHLGKEENCGYRGQNKTFSYRGHSKNYG